ncbi:MAG TPA: ArsC/Spx/MgsR family protein [Syntrophales bacterium]|nr:ArsC/Spx/MgsR family protein [Geobacteraceae bacterium]HPQ45343.1 ArsC/Spx/MgsR family protein [Syntrophales bacterium]
MQKGVEINERDFFKNPFSRNEIEDLLQGKPASEMFNFRSPSFKQMGLEKDTLTDENLIELMLEEPRLIRRPVVRIGTNVYFGANDKLLAEIVT